MAINAYTLSMSEIHLDKIIIGVTDKATQILAGEVKIKRYNGTAFELFSDFSLEAGATNSTATIIPNTGFEFTDSDLLLIQIIAPEGDPPVDRYSDLVIVDYEQQYANHQAEYDLTLPLATGNYILKLDNVVNEDFSAAPASPEFTLENKIDKPTPAGSSIALSRPNLVHFAGDILEVTVTLNNGNNDAPDGGYQVSFSADSQ